MILISIYKNWKMNNIRLNKKSIKAKKKTI